MRWTPCLLALAAAGCAAPTGSAPEAVAMLSPTRGSSTTGVVRFTQRANGVEVSGEIRGLKANEDQGFHVHEKGDCSSGDGMSAGGHFNPTGQPHGRMGPGPHHAGDLASLHADANGVAQFRFIDDSISVGPGVADVVGRAVIVHRDPDDYTTQPTGNSGPRLACGVIERR